jgi:hypothetical protein
VLQAVPKSSQNPEIKSVVLPKRSEVEQASRRFNNALASRNTSSPEADQALSRMLLGRCGIAAGQQAPIDCGRWSAAVSALRSAAYFLQLEANGGCSVSAGPEVFTGKVPVLAAQAGNRDGALPLQKTNHRRHWVLGRNGDAHAHVVRHQVAFDDLTFLLPCQRVKDRTQLPTRLAEEMHSAFVSLRTQRDICSPILNWGKLC